MSALNVNTTCISFKDSIKHNLQFEHFNLGCLLWHEYFKYYRTSYRKCLITSDCSRDSMCTLEVFLLLMFHDGTCVWGFWGGCKYRIPSLLIHYHVISLQPCHICSICFRLTIKICQEAESQLSSCKLHCVDLYQRLTVTSDPLACLDKWWLSAVSLCGGTYCISGRCVIKGSQPATDHVSIITNLSCINKNWHFNRKQGSSFCFIAGGLNMKRLNINICNI